MGRLSRLREIHGETIGDILDDLTVLTPLNDLQLRDVYGNQELAELNKWLAAVREATDDNDKIAKLTENGTRLLKFVKTIGVAI